MQIPIESLNFLVLNTGLARHNADWNWTNVHSPFTRFFLVTEGRAVLVLPNGRHELTPGHIYMVPAYTRHSYECDGPFTHYYLHVYERCKSETAIFDFYDFPTEVNANEDIMRLLHYITSEHPELKLPLSDPQSYDNNLSFGTYVDRYNNLPLSEKMMLRGALLMIFSHFLRFASPRIWTQDKRLQAVLEYIHKNIYDNIDISALANMACVSKSYFIRNFTNALGISPLQYINQKKIERAQLLLLTENMQVKEVAYAMGYNDHSYFVRLFRKIVGIPPMEYRKKMM